jgi:hypothetical protein
MMMQYHSLSFFFSLFLLSTHGVVVPLVWRGEESFPVTTILARDRVEWRSEIPFDNNQPFSLISLAPPPKSKYDLQFYPEYILYPDQPGFYTAHFAVAGNYSFVLEILVNNTLQEISGTICVVPGIVWNQDTNYYDLMVGDILRWYIFADTAVIIPDAFQGFSSNPGKSWYRTNPMDATVSVYDYQFLIPGTYTFRSSPYNMTSIQVRTGVNVHWSSSMLPQSSRLWLGDVVRLIWTVSGEHSPIVRYYSFSDNSEYYYSLGTFYLAGEMVNTTVERGLRIQVTEISNQMNMRFESSMDIGLLKIIGWRFDTSQSITIPVQTTLRFYVTDGWEHNVRLNGPTMETVSDSISDPGAFVEIFFNIPGKYRATCDYHEFQGIDIIVIDGETKAPSPSNSMFVDSLIRYAGVSAMMIGILGLSTFLPQQTSCNQSIPPSQLPPLLNQSVVKKGMEELTNAVLTKVSERENERDQGS